MPTGNGVSRCTGRRTSARALALVLAVIAAGCGTRLSHQEVLADNMVGPAGAARTSVPASAVGGGDVDGVTADTTVAAATDAEAGGQSQQAAAGPTGAQTAAAGAKAPLPIAMVGWMSGIGGQTSSYARDVLVAWSKWVNARGGIKGHPVQLYVADDGGNEARSVSIVRDFVENKHVVALVYYTGGSAVGVANYLKTKNVPIIGGNIIEQVWNQNPMLFPTQSSTEGHFWGAAKLALDSGAKKVATVFCTEVAACQQSNDTFVKEAREIGLDVVYQGRISFTQPDYTAECLQMRNAGAQAVVPITENSSTVRLAQSCGRQQFKPTYVLQAVNDGMAKIPEFDHAIGNLATFPWFLHGGFPGLDEYTQAMQRYAPGHIGDGVDVQSGAWIAGKAFEAAAAHVSDHPTSQEVLQGLWAMRGETLGGLLVGGMARTFTANRPTPETFCVYDTRVEGGRWTSPRGMTPVCR